MHWTAFGKDPDAAKCNGVNKVNNKSTSKNIGSPIQKQKSKPMKGKVVLGNLTSHHIGVFLTLLHWTAFGKETDAAECNGVSKVDNNSTLGFNKTLDL